MGVHYRNFSSRDIKEQIIEDFSSEAVKQAEELIKEIPKSKRFWLWRIIFWGWK